MWIQQQKLLAKFPSFRFVKSNELTQEEYEILSQQIHLNANKMSKTAKAIFKKVKQESQNAKFKLKKSKKLYKLLKSHTQSIPEIILNDQQIDNLQALQNQNLSQLTDLQLSCNRLKNINELKNLVAPYLQNVDFSSNQIVDIKSIPLHSWKKLTILNLSQNCICSIECFAFAQTPFLSSLNLSQNYIIQIKSLRKSLFANLKQMDLSSNKFLNFHYLTFFDFQFLKKLNLKNNNIDDCCQLKKLNIFQPRHQCNQKLQIGSVLISINLNTSKTGFWLKKHISYDLVFTIEKNNHKIKGVRSKFIQIF